ncbi:MULTISPECIES: SUKH-4 family immunity protein [unclassified Streptomyces]|uniref:SUKH-4 family immunity protein n=1 Tax=unclassified Streptomyces TaxID=2593676 RepID=UPI0035D61CB7
MLSRDILVDVFDEENIITLDFDDAVSLGLSELDALLLSHVGLPRDIGTAFTTELEGSPGLFSVQPLDTPDGTSNAAIFLGAPGRKQMMRYFLDVKNSLVVLCSLDDANPAAEVINSSFSNFVDFIHHIGVFYQAEGMSPDEERRSADELAEHLRERDPYAFREPKTWWSMAISTIVDQTEGGS